MIVTQHPKKIKYRNKGGTSSSPWYFMEEIINDKYMLVLYLGDSVCKQWNKAFYTPAAIEYLITECEAEMKLHGHYEWKGEPNDI